MRARCATQGVSEKKAPELIAEEIEQTRSCPRKLALDARRGLAPPRALVDALTVELRLDFRKHKFEVALPGAHRAPRALGVLSGVLRPVPHICDLIISSRVPKNSR